MAAHRYWRASAIESYAAGGLELSCFHLLDVSGRIDATATLSASSAPDISGSLTNLQDADLSTSAHWSAGLVPTLTLQWDFAGAPADVLDIRLAGDNPQRFPLIVRTDYSDDGVSWTIFRTDAGITWPGPLTMSSGELSLVFTGGRNEFNTLGSFRFDGADASTTITDETGRPWAAMGGAKLSTTKSVHGGSSLRIGSISDYVVDTSAALSLTSSYTVEAWVCIPAMVVADGNCILTSGNNSYPNRWLLDAYISAADTLTVRIITSGNSIVGSYSCPYTAGTFTHIAWVNDSTANTFKIYVGGTVIASRAAISLPFHTALMIGKNASIWSEGAYYIDELHISSEAIYSSNFTPVTATDSAYRITRNTVKGRSSSRPSPRIGSGATIEYGVTRAPNQQVLTTQAGGVKDYTTGVLGQGIGRVQGTVKTTGTPNAPVFRKVRLIRERDGLCMREQWSNAVSGAYDFQYIDELQTWTVVSYDYQHNFRAVIADNITPELMP